MADEGSDAIWVVQALACEYFRNIDVPDDCLRGAGQVTGLSAPQDDLTAAFAPAKAGATQDGRNCLIFQGGFTTSPYGRITV